MLTVAGTSDRCDLNAERFSTAHVADSTGSAGGAA